MDTNNITHLTNEERRIIESGIRHGSTKTAIAKTIGKDNSTVGKEIKLHRKLKHPTSLSCECSNYKQCKYGREGFPECDEYKEFTCKRRDRSPGACNGCRNYSHCRFNKYIYDPDDAEHEYRMTLVDSRSGYNITTLEAKELGEKIQPLLKQGLSPYAILQAHPEIKLSEKTLYTYIENKVFEGLVVVRQINCWSVRHTKRDRIRRFPSCKNAVVTINECSSSRYMKRESSQNGTLSLYQQISDSERVTFKSCSRSQRKESESPITFRYSCLAFSRSSSSVPDLYSEYRSWRIIASSFFLTPVSMRMYWRSSGSECRQV